MKQFFTYRQFCNNNFYKSAANTAPELIADIEKDFEQEQLSNQALQHLYEDPDADIVVPADMQVMISFMLKRFGNSIR